DRHDGEAQEGEQDGRDLAYTHLAGDEVQPPDERDADEQEQIARADRDHAQRERMSRYTLRTHCASAPTGRPGRSFGFQAYRSMCSQRGVAVTKRLRNS